MVHAASSVLMLKVSTVPLLIFYALCGSRKRFAKHFLLCFPPFVCQNVVKEFWAVWFILFIISAVQLFLFGTP